MAFAGRLKPWLVHAYPAIVAWPLVVVETIPNEFHSGVALLMLSAISVLLGMATGQDRWGMAYALIPFCSVVFLVAQVRDFEMEWIGKAVRFGFSLFWVLWLAIWMLSPLIGLISISVEWGSAYRSKVNGP